jgi:hypothetical protein
MGTIGKRKSRPKKLPPRYLVAMRDPVFRAGFERMVRSALLTLSEVSAIISHEEGSKQISRERVRQIEISALYKIYLSLKDRGYTLEDIC